jgi:ferredoxin-NADP reductase
MRDDLILTKIINIRQETPIVKVLTLDLQGQAFNFLPGQWIDCYAEIDGKQEVAGYSGRPLGGRRTGRQPLYT